MCVHAVLGNDPRGHSSSSRRAASTSAETAGKGLFFCSFQKCHYVKTQKGSPRLFWKMALQLFELCEAAAHTWLFFFFSSSNYELVCVLGASGSMTECFNLYKQAKTVKTFFSFFFSFLCCRLIQSCFDSPGREKKKPCMFSII